MRDFRDAKAMSQTLRETLRPKGVGLSVSESLEIVAKMFGVEDWNTLSAAIGPIKETRQKSSLVQKLPALPIKDVAPFPGADMTFWLKRPESIRALEIAHSGGRQVVLVAQRTTDTEEPSRADVYEVGVTGRVLDIGPPAAAVLARAPHLEGSTQVIVQTHQRVSILAFSVTSAGYEADVEAIVEQPMREEPELVRTAVDRFEEYASTRQSSVRIPNALRLLHDPGRVADVIAHSLMLSVENKQSLLATVDSAKRLRAVLRHLEAA